MTIPNYSFHRLLRARRSEVSKLIITTTTSRENDNLAEYMPYTLYTFQLQNSAIPDAWTIRKRYSQCFTLYSRLQEDITWRSIRFQQPELFRPTLRMLVKASGTDFPPKDAHIDTDAIIRRRRIGLTNFVLALLAVYTDLDVLIQSGIHEVSPLTRIYSDIASFLEIPRKRKEMTMQIAQLILVLKEVQLVTSCCICLSCVHPQSDTLETELETLRHVKMAKVTITTKAYILSEEHPISRRYTQYIFTLEISDGIVKWILPKRYSECFDLHFLLGQGIPWVWTCLAHQQAFEPLVRMIQHATGPTFPRKHLRRDNQAIIHERSQKLADFVLMVLTAYTQLEVLVRLEGHQHFQLLFRHLEKFLAIPPQWKIFTTQNRTDMETSQQNRNSEYSYLTGNLTHSGTAIVTLPCGHAFHDDCIISWLCSNATCPVCRRVITRRVIT